MYSVVLDIMYILYCKYVCTGYNTMMKNEQVFKDDRDKNKKYA